MNLIDGPTVCTTDITYHLVRSRREKDEGSVRKGREGGVVDKKEGHEKWYEVHSGQVKLLLVSVYLQQNKKGENRGYKML